MGTPEIPYIFTIDFSFCGKSTLQKVYLAQGLKGTIHPDRGGEAADHMAPIVTWYLWSHGTHSYKAWRRMNFSFSIFILPAIPAVRRCHPNLGGVLASYSQEGHSQICRKLFISLIPQAFCFLWNRAFRLSTCQIQHTGTTALSAKALILSEDSKETHEEEIPPSS